MRLRILALAVLCIATTAAFSQPGPNTPPDKALMQKIWDAWSTLNVQAAAKYYAPDAGFPFYDVAPIKYDNWQLYAQGAQQLFTGFKSMKAVVGPDAMIRNFGKTSLGTATIHLDIVDKENRPAPLDIRWTAVWEKRGSQWLIIHEHVSAPLPPHAID